MHGFIRWTIQQNMLRNYLNDVKEERNTSNSFVFRSFLRVLSKLVHTNATVVIIFDPPAEPAARTALLFASNKIPVHIGNSEHYY